MAKPKYKRGIDGNHAEIAKGLRSIPGVSVFDATDVGGGFPDLVVGYRDFNYLFEVKTENGKQNANQVNFENMWRGSYHIIIDLDHALRIMGII